MPSTGDNVYIIEFHTSGISSNEYETRKFNVCAVTSELLANSIVDDYNFKLRSILSEGESYQSVYEKSIDFMYRYEMELNKDSLYKDDDKIFQNYIRKMLDDCCSFELCKVPLIHG